MVQVILGGYVFNKLFQDLIIKIDDLTIGVFALLSEKN